MRWLWEAIALPDTPASVAGPFATVSTSALLFRAGARVCALSVQQVLEVMRPLPVQEVVNLPLFVQGLTMIRGAPTPVVSLASLFADSGRPPTRFVVVRAGDRPVALAVDSVLGVIELGPATLHALPPQAQSAGTATLLAIGALDAQLLFVLNSTSLIPDEVWQRWPLSSHD